MATAANRGRDGVQAAPGLAEGRRARARVIYAPICDSVCVSFFFLRARVHVCACVRVRRRHPLAGRRAALHGRTARTDIPPPFFPRYARDPSPAPLARGLQRLLPPPVARAPPSPGRRPAVGAGDEGAAGVEEVVRLLRRFATGRGVHVTAVIHPRKEGDAARLTASSVAGSAAAQASPPAPRPPRLAPRASPPAPPSSPSPPLASFVPRCPRRFPQALARLRVYGGCSPSRPRRRRGRGTLCGYVEGYVEGYVVRVGDLRAWYIPASCSHECRI